MKQMRTIANDEIHHGISNENLHELGRIWKTVDEANGLSPQRKDHTV